MNYLIQLALLVIRFIVAFLYGWELSSRSLLHTQGTHPTFFRMGTSYEIYLPPLVGEKMDFKLR